MRVYSKAELDNMANGINQKFYPERLIKPMPLDGYDLLEKLGCEIEWKYLTPNDDILGITCFEDTDWYVWPHNKLLVDDKPFLEFFKNGTIVINQILLDKKDIKKENFVVCHEAMHWYKDQEYFLSLDDTFIQICKKNSFDDFRLYKNFTNLEIIESQTNYLAAALLLPNEILKETFFKIGRYRNIPDKPIKYEIYMKKWIKEISEIYRVNFNLVLYRLYDIGVLKKC